MARQSNEDYWAQRMKLMEDALKDRGYAYVENMERQFTLAQADVECQIAAWYQRVAANNEITLADAKRLLTAGELEEFRWTVGEYIAYGQQNALDGAWMKQLENASARVHISRLEAIKLQIQQQAEALYGNQLDAVDAAVREIYLDSYYHTAFEVQRGLGVGWTMQAINENTITKVLSRPWTTDGKTFRDKCWTNKQALVNSVNTQLTQMIIRGEAPDRAIKAIAHQFDVSKGKAGRLVMTEAAAFSSAAQKDCFSELGVERYKIVASFDGDICELCGALDGQVFKMSDYQVGLTAPPFHPWCRCCICPYFEDMARLGERWTRKPDGSTEKVPADMSFEEWKGKFVNEAQTGDLTAAASDDKINIHTAKDWDALGKYMEDTYGISIDDSVRELNFETVRRSVSGIDAMMQEFPDIGDGVKRVLTGKTGIMSCTGQEITFNPAYYSDTVKLLQTCSDMEKTHFWVHGVSPESIGVHEAAHGLEWVLLQVNPAYDYDFQRVLAWNQCTEAKGIVSQACKNVKKTVFGKGKVNGKLISDISTYATTNASETMAEAFADVYANGEGANPLSVEIKRLAVERLKQYKGG